MGTGCYRNRMKNGSGLKCRVFVVDVALVGTYQLVGKLSTISIFESDSFV